MIIVAGGKGLRMGGELPKQFLPLSDGRPVLMHTLEVFQKYHKDLSLLLVLPQEQMPFWKKLCKKHDFRVPHRMVAGGETRFHSVRNGVLMLPEGKGLVAVHDGVRPFVSAEVITRCFKEAALTKAVIPVIDILETIRYIADEGHTMVDRNAYKLVQTPQVFDADLLRKAYKQPYTSRFTDDASVVEALGISVSLVEGNRENIKITTPFDLKIAEALMTCSI